MSVIHTGLFILYERFPDRRALIKARFMQSEAFKTLCSDYQECLKALEHWNQSTDGEAGRFRQEYQALLLELEEEVMQYLENGRQ